MISILVVCDVQLDVAFFRVSPKEMRGLAPFELAATPVIETAPVKVVGHPLGVEALTDSTHNLTPEQPKDNDHIWYSASTHQGSSGSPVLQAQEHAQPLALVALHCGMPLL
jgi:V8-like Glu-specific endopeptidase